MFLINSGGELQTESVMGGCPPFQIQLSDGRPSGGPSGVGTLASEEPYYVSYLRYTYASNFLHCRKIC